MSNAAAFIWPGMFTFDNGVVTFGSGVSTGVLLPASDYINFGTTAGTSGYGFRDNSGAMEFKNSGGSWAAIASASTVAPIDATYITQTPNATLTNEQALSALSTGVLLSTTTTGVVSSLGVGTVAQALIGGATPGFGNLITVTALATTSTDGWVLSNTTAATGGATVQISPRLRLRGNAWDTAASQTDDFFIENLPVSAATPSGILKFGHSLNGAAATYPMTLTSAGVWSLNKDSTHGFQIDPATDHVAAFLDRTGADNATVKADIVRAGSWFQLTGTVAGAGGLRLPSSTTIGTVDGKILFINTDNTSQISLDNGSAGNGQIFKAVNTLTELTTIAAAATTDTTIQMPANSVVLAVSVRVTTVIPTAATFTVGDSGSATRFSTAAVSAAATSTDPGTKAGAYYNASALSIRITPNAQPADNSGRVRTTIYYYSVTPPTS